MFVFCLLRRPEYTSAPRSISNSSKFFSISKTVSINPIKHEVKGNGYTFKRLLRSCLEIGLESLYRLPVAKGIYLSFTPKSLRRTPYHAGLSLIYNLLTQLANSFNTRGKQEYL